MKIEFGELLLSNSKCGQYAIYRSNCGSGVLRAVTFYGTRLYEGYSFPDAVAACQQHADAGKTPTVIVNAPRTSADVVAEKLLASMEDDCA